MPTVFFPAQLRPLTGGRESVDVDGKSVRQVVEQLERLYPGISERLVNDGRLRPNISVAVDGVVSPLGLLEETPPDSEIHFVTAISGG